MKKVNIDSVVDDHIKVAENSRFAFNEILPLMSSKVSSAFTSGHKLLICGNGGSAADAQHLAAEFVSGFSKKLKRSGLPAIALTTDTSILTAFSNDFDFSGVFARQVEALGRKGDVLLTLSTSGESVNCINAVLQAKKLGMTTLAFTGLEGKLKDLVDLCLRVNSTNTQHIQEVHQVAYHLLAGLIETELL
jgi:D-sedoheptulose 7-phosphate isomerase